MRAVYRATPTAQPVSCEILAIRVDGIVCREIDKLFPGVFLAQRGTLRRPVTASRRAELKAVEDPAQKKLLAKLKKAGVA